MLHWSIHLGFEGGATPSRPSQNTLRFAAFEVDPHKGELRKHGLRIRLQDQPFKILIALLEKQGEVVSRDELRERIWGSETFVDFNHGLNAAVNRLRDALGDSADNPRYVETVARRGYCFIAPVEGLAAPVAPASVDDPPVIETIESSPAASPMPARGGGFSSRLLWTGVAVLTAAGVAGIGLWWALPRSAGPSPRLVQVTSLSGSETMPTFSPDGAQIAFVWNGEKESDADIYVKLVGSESALRLTKDPGADLLPSWSPDGRNIAFVRIHGTTGIYLVSPLVPRPLEEFALKHL